MNVTVLGVGAPSRLLTPAIREYEERAGRYWKLQTATVDPEKASKNRPVEEIMATEAERLRAAVPDRTEGRLQHVHVAFPLLDSPPVHHRIADPDDPPYPRGLLDRDLVLTPPGTVRPDPDSVPDHVEVGTESVDEIRVLARDDHHPEGDGAPRSRRLDRLDLFEGGPGRRDPVDPEDALDREEGRGHGDRGEEQARPPP